MALISALTSTAAKGFAIGPNGATNPVLAAKCDVSSAATGLQIVGRAAGAGADLEATSSGSNENVRLTPKGTGAVVTASPIVITSAAAAAFVAGPNGATNPGLLVDLSTGSAATGLKITPAAAAAGLALAVISSGTNENLTVDAKGSGTITINGTATGAISLARNTSVTGTLAVSNSILTAHATAGLGYATGAGGAVTQATSRATGVTVNKASGAITLVSAAGSATPFSFTVTNSAVAATDTVIVSQKSGTDKYVVAVTAVGAGSFQITAYTTGGTTTEQPVFNFAVLKAVAA